jgi:glucokinase
MPEPSSKTEFHVGVDFGGTKIYAGVFNHAMECIGTARISTKAGRGVDSVIDRIARVVEDAVDEADLSLKQIKALGIGAPGAVDGENGSILFAPNVEGWRDVPLKKSLEKKIGVPVFVENDCNIAILGVYHVELKAKHKSAVGLFIGTGIGGGIILNGQLFSGFNHTAGEVGHMILDPNGPKCGCGNKGCFEAMASRTAIFRRIQAAVKDGEKTVLTEILGSDLDDMRSGSLRKALKRGDKLVTRVIDETAEYIGMGVANMANLLSPEVIILGGGLMEALSDEMLSIIVETAKDYAMPGVLKGVDIFDSRLGDEAGITGGAVLARISTK